jgi:hypothetical protein
MFTLYMLCHYHSRKINYTRHNVVTIAADRAECGLVAFCSGLPLLLSNLPKLVRRITETARPGCDNQTVLLRRWSLCCVWRARLLWVLQQL